MGSYWVKKEYELTSEPVCCKRCRKESLMKVIATGSYVQDFAETWEGPDGTEGYCEQWYYTWHILVCPNCEQVNILQKDEWSEDADQYIYEVEGITVGEMPERIKYLYPLSNKEFAESLRIPEDIKRKYEEAVKCFDELLFSQCIATCRILLERLCKYFKFEKNKLDKRLEEMRKAGVLKQKQFELANTIRLLGNDAVHTTLEFTEKDADDALFLIRELIESCVKDQKVTEIIEKNSRTTRNNDVALVLNKEDVALVLNKEDIENLANLLNNKDIIIGYYAAINIIKEGSNSQNNNNAVKKLLDIYLLDKNLSDRAKPHLKNLGVKALPIIVNCLKGLNDEDKQNINKLKKIISLIAEIGASAKEVVPYLVDLLLDGNKSFEIRNSALNALEKIGIEALPTFLEKHKNK